MDFASQVSEIIIPSSYAGCMLTDQSSQDISTLNDIDSASFPYE